MRTISSARNACLPKALDSRLYYISNTPMTLNVNGAAPVLALNNLSKTYGRRGGGIRAVRGVSLAVGAGEVYGFLGPNGAGKSTTIRMLIGLISPNAGRGSLFGRELEAGTTRR